MPPFNVRNDIAINDELGYSALPSNFTALPLVTFTNSDIWDDCGFRGCKYAAETNDARSIDPATYTNFTDISDAAKPGTQEYLNLTDEEINDADFIKMNTYTDTARALQFEGTYPGNSSAFTNSTLRDAFEIQKITLEYRLTDEVRDLIYSRMMRRPIAIMQYKVDQLIGKVSDSPNDPIDIA